MQAGDQGAAARAGLRQQGIQAALGEYGIEGGDGFIGQHQVRLLIEHPGYADPLQLATGELAAALLPLVGEAEAGQFGPCTVRIAGAQQREQGANEGPLAESASQHGSHHRLGGGQRRLLPDHADPAAQPLAGPGGEGPGIFPPQGECQLTAQLCADQPQQAGLARAARPYDGDTLPRLDLQVKRMQDAALAEPQPCSIQRNGDHFSRPAWVAAASMP